MHIGRTLPPAAAPLGLRDIINGLRGMLHPTAAIAAFERSIRRFFRTDYCFTVSSGAAALTLILRAARELAPSRDIVIVPAYTCYSVPASVKRAGLEIHPCDIDPHTLDFDHKQLARTLQMKADRVLAVVPTHLFGFPADVNRVRQLIGKAPIFVIEDAAQAMGAVDFTGSLGLSGDIGFFSLGRGKAFSTMGGGIIITNHKVLGIGVAQQVGQSPEPGILQTARTVLMALFVYGLSVPALFWLPKAMPFLGIGETVYDPDFSISHFSGFQAGLAQGWEKRLANFQERRKRNAQHWRSVIAHLPNMVELDYPDFMSNLIRFPLALDQSGRRKALLENSERRGLGIMPGYPDAITHISQLRQEMVGYDCPQARRTAKSLVTLPVHSWVGAGDRARIAAELTLVDKPNDSYKAVQA